MTISRRQFVKNTALTSFFGMAGTFAVDSAYATPLALPSDITSTPVHVLTKLVRSKKLSSVEIVSAFIKRIEAVNPKINAVVAFRPEKALDEARKSDNELSKGIIRGALHGIPCTIKDSFDTAGIVTTAGMLSRNSFIPEKSATAVQRLIDAGAIIMGKTNTPELTMEVFTNNLVYGLTKNPFNLDRSPGGSSGGAAAIIAAGGSPFDLGTDTGGSIRFPAHCCGIAGLKPTAGRVPRTGHIIAFHGVAQSLTHVGPLSRHVEDIRLLMNIISGVDNIDPYIYPVPLRDARSVELKKIRVAFHVDNGLYKPSEDTHRAIQRLVKIISDNKITISEAIPEGIREAVAMFGTYLDTGEWLRRMLEQYGNTKTALTWIDEIAVPKSTEFVQVVERIDRVRSAMLTFWNTYDVLICPVSPLPAPLNNDEFQGQEYHSYNTAYNVAGWPSLVVRAGTSQEGLPIGVQVIAPPWREDICLSLGKFLEYRLDAWQPPVL